MPNFLGLLDNYLYSSSYNKEESDYLQSVKTNSLPDQPSTESSASSNKLVGHSTYPLSQALVQSIYNKGYNEGIVSSSSSVFNQLSTYISNNSTTSLIAFGTTIMVFLITGSSLLLTKRSGKNLLIDNSKKTFKHFRPLVLRDFNNSSIMLARRKPSTSLSSQFSKFSSELGLGAPADDETIEKALNELRENLEKTAKDYHERNTSIGKDIEDRQIKFGDIIEDDKFGQMLADSLNQLLENRKQEQETGILKSNKISFNLNPEDTEWKQVKPISAKREAALEDMEDISSVPSTYLTESAKKTKSKADSNVDNNTIDEAVQAEAEEKPEIDTGVMTRKEIWSKARFEVVDWQADKIENGVGEMTIKLWTDGKPEEALPDLTVLAEYEDSEPVSIFHGGLEFAILETDQDTEAGESIWRFTELIKNHNQENAEENEVNEHSENEIEIPASQAEERSFFDELLYQNREKNQQLFEKPVPKVDVKELIKSIEKEEKFEFYFDEKIGNATLLKNGAKKEIWKIRLAIYTLYGEPKWSEIETLVHFKGFPTKFILDKESNYSVDIWPGSNGSWVVRGQEEEEL
ncbi:uncharacterized protein L201_001406 [Kwoniella dendrophila CBS 6074]|uniref:Uncharacterized protein n=1 Tax=Kwoniella dendrophila CBS 6074 TaxID=1295534 RepID=A0AAX4JP56_9TREE